MPPEPFAAVFDEFQLSCDYDTLLSDGKYRKRTGKCQSLTNVEKVQGSKVSGFGCPPFAFQASDFA
jgi:hypothetical protein